MGEQQYRKLTGSQLVNKAHETWDEQSDQLPTQHKRELGQVLTELSTRINYICQGEQPKSFTKYSSLGGSELSQHATRTVSRVAGDLPVESRSDIQSIVSEMANRVEHAAIGTPTPTTQTQRSMEDNFEKEFARARAQGESAVFA